MSNINIAQIPHEGDTELVDVVTPDEALTYIGDLVGQLESICKAKKFTTLASILGLARYEAERQERLARKI